MEDDQFDARLSRLSTPITRRAGVLGALGAAGAGMVTEAEARKKKKKKVTTTPAPLPAATQALFRSGDGGTETNTNAADFSLKTPLPRTSAFSQVCS